MAKVLYFVQFCTYPMDSAIMRYTKIRMNDELRDDITPFLNDGETLSNFIASATKEKLHRMQANSKKIRVQQAIKDKNILEPIVKALLKDFGVIK